MRAAEKAHIVRLMRLQAVDKAEVPRGIAVTESRAQGTKEMHYERDGSAVRKAVRVRDCNRCTNCRRSGDDVTLDVHHIVPRGQGGSGRMSNLILLCRRCHDAAHHERMAPRIRFYSNGQMTNDEFGEYHRLMDELKSQGFARFDGNERCWYVPKADVSIFLDELES